MKKKIETVNYKLNLAFFILYYFDLISFYNLKNSSEENKKTKTSLRLKVKSFKNILAKYFFNLPHNEAQKKQKSILLTINYLTNLNQFDKKFKQKRLFTASKTNRSENKTIKHCNNFLRAEQSSQFLLALSFLEHFLNV